MAIIVLFSVFLQIGALAETQQNQFIFSMLLAHAPIFEYEQDIRTFINRMYRNCHIMNNYSSFSFEASAEYDV